MFQNACKSIKESIIPIVIVSRTSQGKVDLGVSAGVMVNEDGWFVTASHNLKKIESVVESAKNYDPILDKQNRARITHYAVIFKNPNFQFLSEAIVNEELDLGVGKIENYNVSANTSCPIFRDDEIEQGEYLCRMGFSFLNDLPTPTWSEDQGFQFTNLFPIPMFANEALASRFVEISSGLLIYQTDTLDKRVAVMI